MEPSSREGDWTSKLDADVPQASVIGGAACAGIVLAFTAWAMFAPLSGAAVAAGYVAVSGQNQRVQHLEGGIIQRILVREGERVRKGQPLFELDPTEAAANRSRLNKLLLGLEAQAARLTAERSDGEMQLRFSRDVEQRARALSQQDVLAEQASEFETRLKRHQQERAILQQGVTALHEQSQGMVAQEAAVARQLQVVRAEAARKRGLLAKGLTDRAEYTALLRSEAELLGQQGQAKAAILTARTQIAESREQIARLETQRVESALTELNQLRATIADTREHLVTAAAVADRTIVRAPTDGLVLKLGFNSIGSVVKPAETLLELLPTSDELVVEARVAPQDVDVVKIGQAARLRFPALNQRTTPTIEATVTYLSADRLLDVETNRPYYVARLSFEKGRSAGIASGDLHPGMPAEAMILTGDRTFLQYLTKPVTDSMSRAFRE
ncbi:HlyD family type I secretion periplasmic adaptor subunit [Tianweitania sediminis]|uniref:Membrane fusion protein (MFP) family protein n=1 Tax=Tianweitania sediminis TaxID=1502156 RepID=A0A8J7UK10_9HYPH|nr:HlyD family type I secretion periplasmic adaptor subunit [Tianweitania sediminis]MBP0440628.1 HlyD family type I secretion periplasmic adaptor subunit [Tianweitania sediminis]